ncbi:MAG: DNA/RNA nuclease SfsA [Clostridia bacterium]|nr:DNA/RNA nuclease SfsA [Clostridia bacterium]
MNYKKVVRGTFLARPNRFIAHVLVDGKEEVVHVKNTGRCRELLIPGCCVYLSVADNPERRTKYDLIAVEKEREGTHPLLINMDSQIPNDIAEEFLRAGHLFPADSVIRREVRYGNSRFDFYLESGTRKAFLEVKGVTLEEEGVALFPDAPTERGIKHLRELIACRLEGYEAYVLFVVQMKGVHLLRPNDRTHKAFGDTLREAEQAGVRILAVDCLVTRDSIIPDAPVPVRL